MFDLIFTPLRRVFLAFLLMVHAVMLMFLMRGHAKAEFRQAFVSVFSHSRLVALAERPVSQKPKIPLLIFNPAVDGQMAFRPGESVRFESNKAVQWTVDHESLGAGKQVSWTATPGQHVIQARQDHDEQRLIIFSQ